MCPLSKMKKSLSRVWLFATPWVVAYWGPLSGLKKNSFYLTFQMKGEKSLLEKSDSSVFILYAYQQNSEKKKRQVILQLSIVILSTLA